jgi:hypothetical protein
MMMKLTAAVFLVTSLMAGCAVDDEPTVSGPDDELDLSTVESDVTVWCTDKAWRVDFYAEPALINKVGYLQCNCWQPQRRGGTVSNYTNLAYEFTCSLD